jgi:hypothetical protein
MSDWLLIALFSEIRVNHMKQRYKKSETPWPVSTSELYLPSVRRLSVKLLPTFADRGCRVTDSYGRILDFLDRSRYSFFQLTSQLYSRG